MSGSPGTYRYSVERGLQRAFAVLTVLLVISFLGAFLPVAGRIHTMAWIASTGFLCYLVVLTFRSWQLRLKESDGIIASVAALATVLANLAPAPVLIPLSARPTPVVVAVILVAGFHSKIRTWLICSTLGFAHVLVTVWVGGADSAIEGLWPILAAPVASAAVTKVLRAAGTRADQAQQSLHEAQVVEAKAAAGRAAHRDFQRILHDDVSAALRAVATVGIDREAVRAACGEAVRRAEQEPRMPAENAESLELLLADLPSPAGLELNLFSEGSPTVPAPVARATLDAARQVLVNVERHARASGVSVHLRGDNDGFTVRIHDDGVGFRPAEVRGTSVGLRDSVTGRMADVGGKATIVSVPGRGTTVELSWSAADAAESGPVTQSWVQGLHAAVDDVRGPLAAVCFPYLLSMAIPVVRHLDAAPSMPWLAGWYGIMATATALLISRADRPFPRAGVRVAALWTAAGAVWALLVIPADSIQTYVSWPVGAIGPILVVLFTLGLRWEATIVLLIQQCALAALVFGGVLHTQSFVEALPAAMSSSLCLVSGAVITSTIAKLGKVVLEAGAERTEIASAAAARDSRLAWRSRRIDEIGREILPFLRDVATGGGLTDDPAATRHRARTLEWMARDELHIPGVLDTGSRRRLETARLDGCVVTIQADTDTMEPPRVVRDLLESALSTSVTPREVILSLHPEPGRTTISLVCVPGDSQRAGLLRATVPAGTVDDEPEATCVEVSVAAR
ncbi:ATP-binding protein [Amycolatopsis sp. NPDC049159]|uniref:sensor histidine kinase n=1 Tax=Amycolatopsis sp. NPDC049159 TaxID=3157210 RepID=UPI0033F7B65B